MNDSGAATSLLGTNITRHVDDSISVDQKYYVSTIGHNSAIQYGESEIIEFTNARQPETVRANVSENGARATEDGQQDTIECMYHAFILPLTR